MSKQSKKLDLNQLAKRIIDEATGEATPEDTNKETELTSDEKRKLHGSKGGKTRAEKLTEEQRREIAAHAASVRWHKVD